MGANTLDHCYSEHWGAYRLDHNAGLLLLVYKQKLKREEPVIRNFIKTCVREYIPTKSVRTFPNQKPWVHTLFPRAPQVHAFQSRDVDLYKKCRYELQKAIKRAKWEYSNKMDFQFSCTRDTRQMWRGIHALTDYKSQLQTLNSATPSLPDEQNAFYAYFELLNLHTPELAPPALHDVTLTVSVVDMKKGFNRVNTRKAAGPNEI